jgi:hypothetical protein
MFSGDTELAIPVISFYSDDTIFTIFVKTLNQTQVKYLDCNTRHLPNITTI